VAHRGDGRVVIAIVDRSRWRAPSDQRSRGRGLAMMRQLGGKVFRGSDHDRTVVYLWAPLPTLPLDATLASPLLIGERRAVRDARVRREATGERRGPR
jgi:hypothetical protein